MSGTPKLTGEECAEIPQVISPRSFTAGTDAWRYAWRQIGVFLPVYFFLALISLAAKLNVTPSWFNGTLARNHFLLTAFRYTNNEQSRLLQFLVPEALVRLFGLQITEAYLLQRWLFVWAAFSLFHLYLRKWFTQTGAFAGVCFLVAILPLTYWNDLQESAPLLMVLFLAALWALREGRLVLFTVILFLGALDNETVLCLPALTFFLQFRGWRARQLWPAVWKTLTTAAPAYLVTVAIRYTTRHQPHLGGAWHWPDNLHGILDDISISPLDYYRAGYLYPFFIFGAFWVYAGIYAWCGRRQRPNFVFCSLLLVPLFILPHLLTGVIREVRQLIPLAYIIIPAAMLWLFGEESECKTDDPRIAIPICDSRKSRMDA